MRDHGFDSHPNHFLISDVMLSLFWGNHLKMKNTGMRLIKGIKIKYFWFSTMSKQTNFIFVAVTIALFRLSADLWGWRLIKYAGSVAYTGTSHHEFYSLLPGGDQNRTKQNKVVAC